MISLHSVSKTITAKGESSKLVFRPTSISLPTDRRVAILGGRQQGKTLLLNLLTGASAPDTGEVSAPLRLSPIANSRRVLHPLFTADENIRIFARISGIDGDSLATAIDAFCGLGAVFGKPVAKLNVPQHQELEIALLSLLPFDCYLLDNAAQVPPALLEHYFRAAQSRGAGTIFTTVVPRPAYLYADCAVVIHEHTLRAFNHVEEAIKSYERKAV